MRGNSQIMLLRMSLPMYLTTRRVTMQYTRRIRNASTPVAFSAGQRFGFDNRSTFSSISADCAGSRLINPDRVTHLLQELNT